MIDSFLSWAEPPLREKSQKKLQFITSAKLQYWSKIQVDEIEYFCLEESN